MSTAGSVANLPLTRTCAVGFSDVPGNPTNMEYRKYLAAKLYVEPLERINHFLINELRLLPGYASVQTSKYVRVGSMFPKGLVLFTQSTLDLI